MTDERWREQREPQENACPQEGQAKVQDKAQDSHRNAAGKCSKQTACDGLQQTDWNDSVVRGKREGEDEVQRARNGAA